MKNTDLILLADYARLANIDIEPAFNWWVSKSIRKKNRILSRVKDALRKNSLKFVIVLPTSVKEALALDKANGNHFWEHAISK